MPTVDGIKQDPNTPLQPPPSDRPIWLAIILIVGVLVGSGVGVVFHLAGALSVEMLTAAGAAFGGTVTLSFAVSRFLAPKS